MVVVEKYPELKSDQNFRDLQAQLEGTENRITVARNRYIQAVQDYNVTVRKFPVNLTAMVFGYKVKPNFTVENEAAIAKPPTVEFAPPPAQLRRRRRPRPRTEAGPRRREAARGSPLTCRVLTRFAATGRDRRRSRRRSCCLDRGAARSRWSPVPTLKARVTDLTGTLTPDQVAALEAKLGAFEQAKGSQVAVLIVPTTQPEEIEQYSIRVAEPGSSAARASTTARCCSSRATTGRCASKSATASKARCPTRPPIASSSRTSLPRFTRGDYLRRHQHRRRPHPARDRGRAAAGARAEPAGAGHPGPASTCCHSCSSSRWSAAGSSAPLFGRVGGALATGGLVGFLTWLLIGILGSLARRRHRRVHLCARRRHPAAVRAAAARLVQPAPRWRLGFPGGFGGRRWRRWRRRRGLRRRRRRLRGRRRLGRMVSTMDWRRWFRHLSPPGGGAPRPFRSRRSTRSRPRSPRPRSCIARKSGLR